MKGKAKAARNVGRANESCTARNLKIFLKLLVFMDCPIVVQSLSCVRLCDPMDCSMAGFPVLHYLPEFAQTPVRYVSDAIQPSYPLSPSSPALNLSQHQGLFQ